MGSDGAGHKALPILPPTEIGIYMLSGIRNNVVS